MKKEYIYILYEGDNIFKIGRTSQIDKRLNAYKTHNSQIEGYIAVFEVGDSKLAEKSLHRQFEDYRVRNEFFELPIDELKNLESRIIGLKTSYLSKTYLDFITLI
jgi:hypothetical protein